MYKRRGSWGVGLLIGVALGLAMRHMLVGISFGLVLGMALNSLYERRSKRNK